MIDLLKEIVVSTVSNQNAKVILVYQLYLHNLVLIEIMLKYEVTILCNNSVTTMQAFLPVG